jgi:hypothetical protein
LTPLIHTRHLVARIYLLVAVQVLERVQRLKAGISRLDSISSSSHHSDVDCYAGGDQCGQRCKRCECFKHVTCEASRWYFGRRRSICLRCEESDYSVYYSGKAYFANSCYKHFSSNMSYTTIGQYYHHLLSTTSLASLTHPPTSCHCRGHWWHSTRPFSNGSHTWLLGCYLPSGFDP